MHSKDTTMGGDGAGFPVTSWRTVRHAQRRDSGSSREAMDRLCRRYWKPVYAYLRAARALGIEDAKDLAQEFFLDLMEGGLLERFQPDRGSFRSYLKGAMQLFLLEQHRNAARLKRGGDRKILNLEQEDWVWTEQQTVASSPEEAFDNLWASSLLDHTLGQLREEVERDGKGDYFRALDLYVLHTPPNERPTYPSVATQLQVTVSDVRKYLNYCYQRLRDILQEHIRDYVEPEDEVTAELTWILTRAAAHLVR